MVTMIDGWWFTMGNRIMMVSCQRHAPVSLSLGNKPGTHRIGSWVVPQDRSGLAWFRLPPRSKRELRASCGLFDGFFRNVGRKLPRRAQLPVWTRIRTPFHPPRSPIARPAMLPCPIAETVVERTWRKLRAPYNFSRMLNAWQISTVCYVRRREHRRC